MVKNSYLRGVGMVFITAFLWGGISPIAKYISMTGLSQLSVMSYRAVFTVVAVGTWLTLAKGPRTFLLSGERLAGFLWIGIFGLVFNSTGFMMSAASLTVPQALMIHYTYPLVTMAASVLITREKPTRGQVLAGFLIILGLYVGFVAGQKGAFRVDRAGLLWGLVSVAGVSGQMLLTRRIMKASDESPLLQLFFSNLFGGAILVAAKSLFWGWSDLSALTPRLFAVIQYPAIASSIVGFGLLFTALKTIPASVASLVCTLEIVFSLLLTPVLLHMIPTASELAGCAIIFAAVVASISFSHRD